MADGAAFMAGAAADFDAVVRLFCDQEGLLAAELEATGLDGNEVDDKAGKDTDGVVLPFAAGVQRPWRLTALRPLCAVDDFNFRIRASLYVKLLALVVL